MFFKNKKEKNKEINYLKPIPFWWKIGIAKDKEYFVENLALLLSSNSSVLNSIEIIGEEMRTWGMKKIIKKVQIDIGAGFPLWKILENTGFFEPFVLALIKLGEESGRLDKNFKVIVDSRRKNKALKSKIRSAMLYPGFVFLLSLIIGIGIAWFILPRLAEVFSQLNIELPLITRWLIGFGEFLNAYGLIVVPGFIGFCLLLFLILFVFPWTRYSGQFLLLSFPGIKKLVQEIEIARMGFIMGTLLNAGFPVTLALDSLIQVSFWRRFRKFYQFLRSSVEEGNSFRKSFKLYKNSKKIIPLPVQQFISAGEYSGSLEKTFLDVGSIFEEKTDTSSKNLAIILEPILLVIVWVGVVFVALAVILPIYSLVGNLNSPREIEEAPVEINRSVDEVPSDNVSEKNLDDSLKNFLEIEKTENGFLNVRSLPSLSGKRVGKVLPGEQYEYIREQDGWYLIVLNLGRDLEDQSSDTWISGDYVKIIQENEKAETLSE